MEVNQHRTRSINSNYSEILELINCDDPTDLEISAGFTTVGFYYMDPTHNYKVIGPFETKERATILRDEHYARYSLNDTQRLDFLEEAGSEQRDMFGVSVGEGEKRPTLRAAINSAVAWECFNNELRKI
jgi:hypothetical protein